MPHTPVPEQAFREAVAIVGRTGSGKTFTARGQVERLLERGDRVCIVDPTGVWHGLKSSADGTQPGFPVAVFGGTHADVELSESTAGPLAELLSSRNLPAIVDLSELSRAGQYRFATRFFEELYAHNREPLTLVIDEADLFAPQKPGKDQLTLLNRVEHIVRRGRVRGFKPWLITQRPAVLHKDVLSQAATLIAMKLTSPQDRDAIGAWIEGQADRDAGKRVLAELPRLPVGEGFVWCPAADYLERVRFDPIKTFDTGRTPEHGDARRDAVTIADVDLAGVLEALDIDRGQDDPKEERRSETPGDTEAATRDAEARGHTEGYERALADVRAALVSELQALRADVARRIDNMEQQLAALGPAEPRAPMTEISVAPDRAPRPAAAARHNGNGGGHSGEQLPRAERLILTALAQYPQGRTKVQIAVMTRYAVNGGGFRNAIGALRTKGYVTGTADVLIATAAGIKALGPFTPLPRGRALLDHWSQQLGRAERKILEALAEAYPRTLSKTQLANRAGYEADGGGFRNALGRLRTLELVHGRAEVKATPEFFA